MPQLAAMFDPRRATQAHERRRSTKTTSSSAYVEIAAERGYLG
jgi:hypothetical protein